MWFLIAILGVGLAVLLIRMQKKPKPPAAEKVDIPKVEEGEQAGRVYGTQWITDPQVHWWGDVVKQAIKKSNSKK